MLSKQIRQISFISFLLITLLTKQLFSQKSSPNLSELNTLKDKMLSWQSKYYLDLPTESLFDTIITFTSSNVSLNKAAKKGYSDYKSGIIKLNASRNQESIMSYDIMGEMYRNSLRTKSKYKNKYVTIEGTVSNITKNIYGEPYAVIDPMIQCFFSDDNPSAIYTLSVTDYVKIKGKVTDMDWNRNIPFMQLSDCQLVQEVNYTEWEDRIRNKAEDFWNTFLVKLEKEISKIDPSSDEKNNTTSNNHNWVGTYKHKNGILVIKNVTGNSFAFSIDVQFSNGIGSISGKASIKSDDFAVYVDDCEGGGKITFEKNDSAITIDESGCINYYHGANAYFDGEYKNTTK